MSSKLRTAAAFGAAAVLFTWCARADAQEGIAGVATDVGNRFINTNTPLTNDPGVFEIVITHRFNQAVKDSGGSSLWGLDGAAEIGLGVEYVPLKNVAVQIYRARSHADYEFAAKVTLLRPTKDFPIAIAARGGVNWLSGRDVIPEAGLQKQSSGFGQLLVSATFSDRLTIATAPTYVERTTVQTDVWSVPVMAQLKITKSVSLIGEFIPKSKADLKTAIFPCDNETRTCTTVDLRPVYQWSVMLQKSVYHHRFGLYIGNTVGSTIDQMMGGDFGAHVQVLQLVDPTDPTKIITVPAKDKNGNRILTGGVTDRNIHFGFNVIRSFDFPPK